MPPSFSMIGFYAASVRAKSASRGRLYRELPPRLTSGHREAIFSSAHDGFGPAPGRCMRHVILHYERHDSASLHILAIPEKYRTPTLLAMRPIHSMRRMRAAIACSARAGRGRSCAIFAAIRAGHRATAFIKMMARDELAHPSFIA